MEPMNEDWIEKMRKDYNAPPETPADEMWSVIEGRLGSQGPDVIPISATAASPTFVAAWSMSRMGTRIDASDPSTYTFLEFGNGSLDIRD